MAHVETQVAPFAGAWIEIEATALTTTQAQVAPFAGAWIEMDRDELLDRARVGRSLRGSVD